MAAILKYQSQQIERNTGGKTTTQAWTGTREEMEALAAELQPGELGEGGTLESVRIYQDGGNIWACERRYSVDQDGDYTNKPNVVYGRKSATLHGGMLSLPLESHPGYFTCWNYYLFGSPDVTDETPDWWEEATDTILTNQQSQNYAWGKSMGELPVDNRGRWKVIEEPTKPGVTSYDVAVYTITETAKYKSAKAAGTAVQNCLNQIGFPQETFGNTGGDWKCDDATVSYNGSAWFATMTWTRSGDDDGWDPDLYGDDEE